MKTIQLKNGSTTRAFRSRQRGAFSLVELLVVVSIIALLLAIALPSTRKAIRQARETVCKSNLKEVYLALDIYRTENNGWLPTAADSASAFRTADAWWTRLVAADPAVKGVLICPDDPWAVVLRQNLARGEFGIDGAGSYGLNDFIVSSPNSYLGNLDRNRPSRPGETILVADMGPDPLGQVQSPGVIRPPQRNFGRLAIDDMYRPGDPPSHQTEPWLTQRHLGGINVLTMDGSVRDVPTGPILRRDLREYYDSCAAGGCTICLELNIPHYSFANGHAYWWTGPLPQQ